MNEARQLEDAPWGPQPGPQTAFAMSSADIGIFGGSAGSGKSFALLYESAKWTADEDVVGYRAVLFRRTGPELVGGGGLWDESQALFRAFGGRPRAHPNLDWIFEASTGKIEDRHRIEFRHLQNETDVYAHQGRQYALIAFDELTHFTEKQFWYMVSRLRSACGVRPYLRATCNPDPDSFVAKLLEWWIGDDGFPIVEHSGRLRWIVRDSSGELCWYDSRAEALADQPDSEPLSFTFIAAKLADNVALEAKDPGYRSRLKSLIAVDRERLLGGNWKVRATAGKVLPRIQFKTALGLPSEPIAWVRCWDKGATLVTDDNPDPDWTRGVRVALCKGGGPEVRELWIDDVVSLRNTPTAVVSRIREVAEADGPNTGIVLWQSLGDAGVMDVDTTRAKLAGFAVHVLMVTESITRGFGGRGKAKLEHAKRWAPLLADGRVYVRANMIDDERGTNVTDELIGECDRFPSRAHDDIVDAISGAAIVLLTGSHGGPSTLTRQTAEPVQRPRLDPALLSRGSRGARSW